LTGEELKEEDLNDLNISSEELKKYLPENALIKDSEGNFIIDPTRTAEVYSWMRKLNNEAFKYKEVITADDIKSRYNLENKNLRNLINAHNII